MDTQGLSIQVTADVAGIKSGMASAGKSVEQLEAQLKRFEASLKTAINPSSVTRLQGAIAATKGRMEVLAASGQRAAAGINQVGKAGGAATGVLVDFGRVAQDAAFGPMAIANNLNPLLEGFERLRKETGSTGGALKAMAASIVGGGGLSLAVSAITAAMSFASVGLMMWGSRAKKSKEETDEFAKSLKDAESSGIKAGIGFAELINAANDLSKTDQQRNASLEKANEMLGKHGKAIGSLSEAYKNGKKYITDYTEAMINQAVAGQYLTKLSEGIVGQRDAVKDLKKANDDLQSVLEQRKRLELLISSNGRNASQQDVDRLDKLKTKENELLAVFNKKLAASKAANAGVADLAKNYGETTKAANSALASFGNANDEIADTTKVSKSKEVVDEIAEAFTNLDNRIKALSKEELLLGVNLNDEKIDAIRNTISEVITLNIDVSDERLQKLLNDYNLRTLEFEYILTPKSGKGKKAEKIELPGVKAAEAPPLLDGFATSDVEGYAGELVETIDLSTEQIVDAMQGLFDGIADAALNGGNVGDVFAGLFGSIGMTIGQHISDLGKTALLANKALDALRASFGVTGLGVGAAVAAIAVGALIKAASKSLTKKPKFASGGVFKGSGHVPGTGDEDNVNAYLMPGEFVVRKSVVQKLGLKKLIELNNGKGDVSNKTSNFITNATSIKKFATGGIFGSSYFASQNINKSIINPAMRAVNSVVVPEMQVRTQEVPYIVSTRVSGQDLRLVLQRANGSYNRST